ncbi:MAG: PG0541 family transporter-associated protein [Mangrovibacterium sp.]
MKSVFIVYNQANTERVEFLLDRMAVKGFTMWDDVKGRGTNGGEPRMGSHTWPEMNSAVMAIVEDEQVEPLLNAVKKLDDINYEVGVKAFVWDILQMV